MQSPPEQVGDMLKRMRNIAVSELCRLRVHRLGPGGRACVAAFLPFPPLAARQLPEAGHPRHNADRAWIVSFPGAVACREIRMWVTAKSVVHL